MYYDDVTGHFRGDPPPEVAPALPWALMIWMAAEVLFLMSVDLEF